MSSQVSPHFWPRLRLKKLIFVNHNKIAIKNVLFGWIRKYYLSLHSYLCVDGCHIVCYLLFLWFHRQKKCVTFWGLIKTTKTRCFSSRKAWGICFVRFKKFCMIRQILYFRFVKRSFSSTVFCFLFLKIWTSRLYMQRFCPKKII